jgi:hypothetical protein
MLDKLYAHPEWDSEILQDLISFSMDCHVNGDLTPIDELMKDLDPTKTNKIYSCGLLRCNFRLHNVLTNWFTFRDRVKEAFIVAGENYEDPLHGLLDVTWYKQTQDSYAFGCLMNIHPYLNQPPKDK